MSIIEATGLRKEYGTRAAVRDVDFRIEAGQVVGLIGPNGAGKTTLLRMLATLLPPSRGEVKILGLEVGKDFLEIRKRIGHLPDIFQLYRDLTLRECLRFFAEAYGVRREVREEKIQETLGFVELEKKQDERIHSLLREEVQRMGLATLRVRDPELYLLDEPGGRQDPQDRISWRDMLKKLSGSGKTVLIASDRLMEWMEFCSHMLIMSKGQIVCRGPVREAKADMEEWFQKISSEQQE
jgi:ABC-2 type transport system ATP-binding protein